MKVAQQRQLSIVALLQTKGEQTVQELAEHFKVSTLTIRRDLSKLASRGVQRFHGGATFVADTVPSLQMRRIDAIAKAAANRISENDIIFVNSSSTALCTLSKVHNMHLTAITNNGKALSTLIDPLIHLVLCGGNITFPKVALTGEFALSNLEKVTATHCIIGISGISVDMGLSTPNLTEVAVNKMMLSRTQGEKIIVADSSKLGHNSAFSSGELSVIDTLITDTDADMTFVTMLRDIGTEVVLVEI